MTGSLGNLSSIKQLKVLELIPDLHLEVVAVSTQHAVKGALTGGETVHPEAEKQKKSIRDISEMLGVAKSTVWYILRTKKSALVSLGAQKSLDVHGGRSQNRIPW